MTETEFESVCQECADYIKTIYEKIVFFPNELNVNFAISDDFVRFTIDGNSRDDGVVIGRQGATIQSLRLFIHAFSKTNMEGFPCIVSVKDHQGSKYNPINSNKFFTRRPRNHTRR